MNTGDINPSLANTESSMLQKQAFAVVICIFNEEKFLENTLRSLLAQRSRPEQVILVDNGSTDDSMALAHRLLSQAGVVNVEYLSEPRPGKVHALEKGCGAVRCEFVALFDADTFYPPQYLELCAALFAGSDKNLSALMAIDIYQDPDAFSSRIRRRYPALVSRLRPHLCFTGGYGQVFRTEALERAGGFSEQNWPYVLLDHEIMVRVHKNGASLYSPDLWCRPSPRRTDRSQVRWNLFERALYHLLPSSMQDWFFYRFLAPRFRKRGLFGQRLRERTWS